MIRINLLPPEIIEKRRDEGRWKLVIIGALIAVGVVGIMWVAFQVQLTLKRSEVASIRQEADAMQGQTQRFAIFEQNEADLTLRKSILDTAKRGRVDWARLLNEFSMVLPSDIFLISLSATEPEGGGVVTLAGKAIDEPEDSPDNGYKSVAKMLVRLTELTQLDNVWLTSTSRPPAGTPLPTDNRQPYVDWAASAKITPEATASVPPAPAPAP